MATGKNVWRISDGSIVLETPKATVAGWTWRDGEMRHTTGQVFRFNAAVSAEIAAAVASIVPARVERKYGHEFTEADRAAGGWTFSGVQGDALGVYTRRTPGTSAEVRFAGADMVN